MGSNPRSPIRRIYANIETAADRATDLAHRFAVQQPSDEPQALVHYRTLLPRHPRLPRKGGSCYPCVRYDLSPMSRAAHWCKPDFSPWPRIELHRASLPDPMAANAIDGPLRIDCSAPR